MMQAPTILLRGTYEMLGRQLFEHLSLQMNAGEWTCLLGPSGVGKSTILRLLAGLETGGTFAGDITASDGLSLANRVTFMAQEDLLLPWLSVAKNVCLGAHLRGEKPDFEKARKLIRHVGLEKQIDQTPDTLSGGERQRVALLRTIMEDRPVILLDEPFSALDAGTRAAMQELAADLFVGRTVLLVTHDPAEAARLSDRIFILDQSRLVETAAPDNAPIRALDDPSALHCQAQLLTILRQSV